MEVQHDTANIRLTASETAHLWTTYMSDSCAVCISSYFIKIVQDPDIRQIVTYALDLSRKHISAITDLFNTVNHPIPLGFTDEDVNLNTKRLYSDSFMLIYYRFMGTFGLNSYGTALGMSVRSDVREFFARCIHSSTDLLNKVDDVLIKKGLFVRPPYIPVPDSAEFVKKQSFLHGFFGDKRPVTSMEIAYLYFNAQTNSLGKSLIMGFSQVAKSKEIREYMLRGKEIAKKHVEVFNSILTQDDIPSPISWDADVMDSTETPFSDKLMMFHITVIIGFGLAMYGLSLSTSMRSDLVLTYTRLMAEIAKYVEDGANIMINHGWLEKMPVAPNRKELAHV
ncbi:MAG: DUF3231 family protein [Clostridia bacterium]|nr:DUF3231 family protein [Clostridia bacterium]